MKGVVTMNCNYYNIVKELLVFGSNKFMILAFMNRQGARALHRKIWLHDCVLYPHKF